MKRHQNRHVGATSVAMLLREPKSIATEVAPAGIIEVLPPKVMATFPALAASMTACAESL